MPNDMEARVGDFQILTIVQCRKLVKHCGLKATVTDSRSPCVWETCAWAQGSMQKLARVQTHCLSLLKEHPWICTTRPVLCVNGPRKGIRARAGAAALCGSTWGLLLLWMGQRGTLKCFRATCVQGHSLVLFIHVLFSVMHNHMPEIESDYREMINLARSLFQSQPFKGFVLFLVLWCPPVFCSQITLDLQNPTEVSSENK